MATQTSMQDWAKGRLADMDAKVAATEGKVKQLQGDARTKGESALADMRARREAFQATIKNDGASAETTLAGAKSDLEAHVSAFEASAQKALSHSGGGTQ